MELGESWIERAARCFPGSTLDGKELTIKTDPFTFTVRSNEGFRRSTSMTVIVRLHAMFSADYRLIPLDGPARWFSRRKSWRGRIAAVGPNERAVAVEPAEVVPTNPLPIERLLATDPLGISVSSSGVEVVWHYFPADRQPAEAFLPLVMFCLRNLAETSGARAEDAEPFHADATALPKALVLIASTVGPGLWYFFLYEYCALTSMTAAVHSAGPWLAGTAALALGGWSKWLRPRAVRTERLALALFTALVVAPLLVFEAAWTANILLDDEVGEIRTHNVVDKWTERTSRGRQISLVKTDAPIGSRIRVVDKDAYVRAVPGTSVLTETMAPGFLNWPGVRRTDIR